MKSPGSVGVKSGTKEIWVIGRMAEFMQVEGKSVDIYFLLDAASTYAFGHIIVPGMLPDPKEVKALFKRARKASGRWPKELLVPNGDPAEDILREHAQEMGFDLQMVPKSRLELLLEPIETGFAAFIGRGRQDSGSPPPTKHEVEEAKAFVPDSYDPCWCGSDKKFKFCCKPIFREIVEAMCAFEEGRPSEALRWMDQARAKVGETGEVLCRYAIIHSLESEAKFLATLKRTLAVAPNHPRAHYLLAANHKQHCRLSEAETEYKIAINSYPGGDRFHLNETWNNLGTVYFNMGEHRKAKEAWEKALMYVPSDRPSKENLQEFIYNNDEVDEELRIPSPFIARYL